MEVHLRVIGRPATSGSKSFMGKDSAGRIIVAPASKYQKPWQEAVKWAAIEAGYNGRMLAFEKDVDLQTRYVFLHHRPKYHFGKKGLKPRYAQARPHGRGDLTKLVRSTEDALTGLVWYDDDQVAITRAEKCFTDDAHGAEIWVQELSPAETEKPISQDHARQAL